MADDFDASLAWRNYVADWHLAQGMPDCGCDDDTTDIDFCAPSIAHADEQLARLQEPTLAGVPDKWNHDAWVAAWGRNVPLVASPNDYRLPTAPPGMAWLAIRALIRGQCAVDLFLYRMTEHRLDKVASARVVAEPTTVQARARLMLQDLSE